MFLLFVITKIAAHAASLFLCLPLCLASHASSSVVSRCTPLSQPFHQNLSKLEIIDIFHPPIVQMMSMGYSMLPMMFSGIQQYIHSIGMGIGMGMGVEMGMNRPVMPFPNMLAGSALPPATPSGAPHLGPRFPLPPLHMPHVDASRMQVQNLPDNHNVPTSISTSDPAAQSSAIPWSTPDKFTFNAGNEPIQRHQTKH